MKFGHIKSSTRSRQEPMHDKKQTCIILIDTLSITQLYSSDLFEPVKYFGFRAKRSRHPGLNKYISSTIERIKPLITSRTLQELCIVFSDPQGCPTERVTFTLALQDNCPVSVDTVEALQSHFSSILLACNTSIPLAKSLPKGSSFELVVYSSSRERIDVNFFTEDSTKSTELTQSSQKALSAHPIKQIQVAGCIQAQVILEQR